ncbi:MAG: L-fuculokinase [Pirellulales bacterium]
MDCLMGIDLGSTSLKAIVYDSRGNAIAAGSCLTERFHPSRDHPEWTVWQPEQIWGGVAAAVRDAMAELDGRGTIRAVAVTGMGMDGLPVDEHGEALYPFISWHDPRTEPQHRWWLRHIGAEKVFSIGGNPLWPINSALRILWMAEHEPEILRRTDKWLLIEDFVNFMLCGRQVTDYSMASCTLLFDQRTLSWSDELIELSGIDRRLLCEVQPSGTRLGEVHLQAAQSTHLPAGTPVVLGGHDHLCGALPVGTLRPGSVLNVMGTWETVITPTTGPVLNDELRAAGMTVQAHVARGMHAIWGGNVAGEMLEWWRKQVADPALAGSASSGRIDWEALMAEASSSPPGARGVMFLPHMGGSACPVVDPRSLGAFVGLSTRATRGDIARSVIEGLNYQFLDTVSAIESTLGTRLDQLVAVGGATRNAFWMQNKADIAGRPVEVPGVEEATPLGAAILAGIGVGIFQDEQDAFERVYRPGKTYEPDLEMSRRYADWFQIYRDLHPAVEPISHRLFEEFIT